MVIKFYRRLKNLNAGEPSGYASNTGRWTKFCALTWRSVWGYPGRRADLRSVCGYPGSSFFSWQGLHVTQRQPTVLAGGRGPRVLGERRWHTATSLHVASLSFHFLICKLKVKIQNSWTWFTAWFANGGCWHHREFTRLRWFAMNPLWYLNLFVQM